MDFYLHFFYGRFLPTNFDRQITQGLKLTGEPYVAFDVAVQTNESWLWHWHVLQMHGIIFITSKANSVWLFLLI